MKAQSLQELVKNIFSSEATKSEFLKNPDSVLARFKLTDEEKKAVLTVHEKMGLVGSNSAQLEAAIRPTWEWIAPIP